MWACNLDKGNMPALDGDQFKRTQMTQGPTNPHRTGQKTRFGHVRKASCEACATLPILLAKLNGCVLIRRTAGSLQRTPDSQFQPLWLWLGSFVKASLDSRQPWPEAELCRSSSSTPTEAPLNLDTANINTSSS
jgi:hypothetical protein